LKSNDNFVCGAATLNVQTTDPALPVELAVGADYGLTVLNGSSPQAYEFAMFILSIDGQRVLAKHGFAAPALPQ
jgi:ABC-type molybdate transport system substrate-binding protein